MSDRFAAITNDISTVKENIKELTRMRSIHGERVDGAADAAAAAAAGLESLEGRVNGLESWVTDLDEQIAALIARLEALGELTERVPMTTPVASSDDAAGLAAADGGAAVMGENTRDNALQVRVHKKSMMMLKFTHQIFLRMLSAHVCARSCMSQRPISCLLRSRTASIGLTRSNSLRVAEKSISVGYVRTGKRDGLQTRLGGCSR